MRSKQEVLERIRQCGIAAVVRGESAEPVLSAIRAVLDGGVDVIEVTFTVPGALQIIERLAEEVGDTVILGAGTVLAPEKAREAIRAGAQFIVAPNINPKVVEAAASQGIACFPGALTPTEVVQALEAGADVVKIFPANVVGPGYLKDLQGPFPGIRLMPTGGVDLNTAADFLKAGAFALGVGGALIDKKLVAAGDWAALTERARAFRKIVSDARAA